MGKLVFLPFSVGSGMLAGLIGKKIFGLIWNQIDDQEAPQSEHRNMRLPKLVLALAIEGALFSLVNGFVDHGSRHAFARMTGTWPGEETPETE